MSLVPHFWKKLLPKPVYEALCLLKFHPDRELKYTARDNKVNPAYGSNPTYGPTSKRDNPFSVLKYTSDPRNFKPENFTIANTRYGMLKLQEGQNRANSKGQDIPAVFSYDPTGLSTPATATWEALDKELAKVKPTHFPKDGPTELEMAEYRLECIAKGRPVTEPPHRWKKVSSHRHILLI
mmetsp:Transcript_21519/g.31261  ORF Transcript_21519/g.31261 Transcript_21519/m.31261 type:complete len:181 (+) Transcript_21519:82-624(+)|eukprot:CAMPEP_0185024414 /NCGR_PEP_ID=MMETSP1103-20130426/7473_1 /TAXON_ID=36769 /ORGANISM="Paraphysomonas bandaiensis, Strain Caron Lab Isolate" /LENGTH=180 /DNA_ID=CAMNT_0027557375 /DNA_START=72 /DNA_END=614 /DNA_ORIENTATION=+